MPYSGKKHYQKLKLILRKYEIGDQVVCVQRGKHFLQECVVEDIRSNNGCHRWSRTYYMVDFGHGDRGEFTAGFLENKSVVLHKLRLLEAKNER